MNYYLENRTAQNHKSHKPVPAKPNPGNVASPPLFIVERMQIQINRGTKSIQNDRVNRTHLLTIGGSLPQKMCGGSSIGVLQ
jgi:hypothetical protein